MKRSLVLLLAVLAAACSGSSNSNSTTGPSPTVVTDTFTGTVSVGGTDFHPFTIGVAGGVNVTMTAAGPPPTIFMGLGVGTPSGSTCVLLTNGSTVTPASATAQLSGTLAAGSYCVMVYDAGNQVADVTYSVTVLHF